MGLKCWGKYLLKSKTAWVNTIATIVPVLEMREFANLLPDHWYDEYVVLLALVNIVLKAAKASEAEKAR